MRILVVGASGYLGGWLAGLAAGAGHEVVGTYFSRRGAISGITWRELDICRRTEVDALVEAVRPDVLVNAAYRSSEWRPTADGAAYLALAAERYGVRLVHVSSDVVFSGEAVYYGEEAVPDPISPYGAAKAAAEAAVAAIAPWAVIVRTSLIIGPGSSTTELVRRLAGGAEGALFTDDIRCAVHVEDLASALLELAVADRRGIHHVAGAEAVSRYDLGLLVATSEGLDPAKLKAGTRTGSGIRGPLDVRLTCAATQAVLTTRLRGASEFLASS